MHEAQQLRKLFEFVGDELGIHVQVIITDGRQPIGRGIGPVLEVRDVMQVLQNDPQAPADLRQKALRLAGRIIEFDPDIRGGQGYAIARDILDSGRALAKMNGIIDAQGRQSKSFDLGQRAFDMPSPADGVVIAIDNLHMARVARSPGRRWPKGEESACSRSSVIGSVPANPCIAYTPNFHPTTILPVPNASIHAAILLAARKMSREPS